MGDRPTATPYVHPHPDRDGVQVIDPIEDTQFSLLTDEPVEPSPCDTQRFHFPIDSAATVPATELETPYRMAMWIRDSEDGSMITEVDDEPVLVPPDRYDVELGTPGMKMYLVVTGGLEITPAEESVCITARDADSIDVGVRSFHEQPTATVTTTDDPRDAMAAISTLGSALKMTSPERSFPLLRGHPPLFERGDELVIPEGIGPPDTGVVLEVPPVFEYIYPVASLAYYLGTDVEPGREPRLLAGGESFPLRDGDNFEETVARVLKQVFLLDCVTRTEGYYEIDLHERRLVEDGSSLGLDFERLYDRPMAERIRRYLSVPYEDIAHAVPRWKLTADVVPEPARLNTLPFLAYELAVIRCPDPSVDHTDPTTDLPEQIAAFFDTNGGEFARNTDALQSDAKPTEGDSVDVFDPDSSESVEQIYVGDGIPLGASKMTVEAYQRRLEFEQSSDPTISVAVVCNDPRMSDENDVSGIYGSRDWIDFDVSVHEELTTGELRSLLRSERDFLHYIGHVDERGIDCSDGLLDARELDAVGTSAVMLNACESYAQGRALVDNGALGGIATVTDVLDEGASAVGRTVAGLLNQGFSLSAILPLITEHVFMGHNYVVIGDGSLTLIENEAMTPYSLRVERSDSDLFSVSIRGHPSTSVSLGSIYRPYINDDSIYYLNSGKMDEFTVSKEDLDEFLSMQNVPVVHDGSLTWSYDLDLTAVEHGP